MRGHSGEERRLRKAVAGSAARIAGSNVTPASTVTAVPIASTGPIQRVAL